MDEILLHRDVRPGDRLLVRAEVVGRLGGMIRVRCEAEVEGIRYAVREPSPQLEDVLIEAVDAVRRAAEGLAQAAERPLGGIVAVEEQPRDAWGNDVRAIEVVGAAATGSSNCSCTRPSCRWQHRSA